MLTKITDDFWIDLDKISSIEIFESDEEFMVYFQTGYSDRYFGLDKIEAIKKILNDKNS